jgi:hypothetical protein
MKAVSYISLVLMLTISGAPLFAQNQNGAPQGFNYQAIARDYNGQEMRNMDIMVRVSIYPGETGPFEWRELHSVTTNKFGLFTIIIGQGTRVEGSIDHFSDIKWGDGARFFEVELDFPNDASGFLPTGKNQLFSVPYALYSNYAANGGSGGILDNDTDPTNERQNLSQTDTLLQLINNDGSIQSSVKNDFDPKNELQDLLINGNILKITNNPDANDINLSPYYDNTDEQILSNKGDSIVISNGNTIDLSRFKDNTDKQQLILETDSIRITNGNAVNISELRNPQSVYFYAEKTTTSTVTSRQNVYLLFNEKKINAGNAYDVSSGTFRAPSSGLYSFYVIYFANSAQTVMVYVNNGEYDLLISAALGDTNKKIRNSFMLFLEEDNVVNIVVDSGLSNDIGKATWSGFKVY